MHRKLATLRGHEKGVQTCAFAPDCRSLLSGADDNVIIEWSAINAKQLRRITQHTAAVTSVKYTVDGKQIISGSTDCSIVAFEQATAKPIASYTALSRITSVATSPHVNGPIAVGDGSGGFYIFREVL